MIRSARDRFFARGTALVVVCLLTFGLWTVPNASHALPTLQLDIAGGTYDTTTDTIIAPSGSFTLYAYLNPDSKNT